jgi:glycosyltransferase involved in cell wall biosynthesis
LVNTASIVVPVYNEENILEANTIFLHDYLDESLDDFELLLVENGSIDKTALFAEKLASNNPRIKTIHLSEPCLGAAIKAGVSDAMFDKVVYFPIDLSVNLSFIPESINLLDTYEIVVGSKKLGAANDHRPLRRRVASTGYHKVVQVLFRTDLSDTTCVKAYQKNIAKELMRLIPSRSNVFETEVLLEAEKHGLSIAQIPVEVNDQRSGRLSLKYKMASKGQDLMSLRVDILSMIVGGFLFLTGLLCITFLSVQKLVFNREGFLNPYSFLISMLLVLFGAQGIAYGLFARLFLQLRKEIVLTNSRRYSGNVFKEETK